LLENLRVPRMGIIGCHAHQFGFERRPPGPAYGFLQIALQWWDQWLKGHDTGVTGEPMLRAYMIDDLTPAASVLDCPGRWIAEPVWPVPDRQPLVLFLNADGLRHSSAHGAPMRHTSLQT